MCIGWIQERFSRWHGEKSHFRAYQETPFSKCFLCWKTSPRRNPQVQRKDNFQKITTEVLVGPAESNHGPLPFPRGKSISFGCTPSALGEVGPFPVPGVGLLLTSAHQHSILAPSWVHWWLYNWHCPIKGPSDFMGICRHTHSLSPTGRAGGNRWLWHLQVHKGNRLQDKSVSMRGRQLGPHITYLSHHINLGTLSTSDFHDGSHTIPFVTWVAFLITCHIRNLCQIWISFQEVSIAKQDTWRHWVAWGRMQSSLAQFWHWQLLLHVCKMVKWASVVSWETGHGSTKIASGNLVGNVLEYVDQAS